MVGFITLPQAIMSVVGGVPVKPAGNQTIIERLRAAKSMMPGDIGGLLGQVLQNGPGAILQNPIGAVMGQLQGQLGNIASAITGALPGDGSNPFAALSQAIGSSGLGGALGQLSSVSNALSGLTEAPANGFGLLDALGHASLLSSLGTNIPAGLGLTSAMGPILMGGNLTPMVGQLSAIATGLTGSNFNIGAAVAQVQGMTGLITGTIGASNTAFATVQGQAVAMAHVASVISALGADSGPMGGIASMLIQPQHIPAVTAALTEQITP